MNRWIAGTGIGLLGLLGLYSASRASSDGGYWLGILLFVAAVLIEFRLIKDHFDGVPDDRLLELWPRQTRSGWIMAIVLAVVGLIGLFVGATGDHALYWFGIALFGACCVLGLLALKAIFDARERNRQADG